MARQPGVLINNKEAYAGLSFAPTVDLRQGGQNGFIPDFRTYISNSAYVQRNLIPFLVEYPRGFDYLPQPEIWIGTLKELVETQAKTIEGLQGSITVNHIDNPIGAAGEVQHDISQVQRAASSPTFTWVEKQGRPIKMFLDGWIFYLMAHPDTQTPAVGSLSQNRNFYFDYLPDFYTMSVLFVEPDPFQRRVIDAWLCVNMMPKGSGDNNGKRDIASAMSGRELSIEFTAMTMMSLGVNAFAQALLDELNYVGLNPHTRRSAIEKVAEEIRSATDGNRRNLGYTNQVNEVASTQNVYGNGEFGSKAVLRNDLPTPTMGPNSGDAVSQYVPSAVQHGYKPAKS